MLIPVKYNEKLKINKLIKMNGLFLKEVYSEIVSKEGLEKLLEFNKENIFSSEIKEKRYQYYLIDEIGFLSLKENTISKIFIYKNFRKQGLGFKAINELKGMVDNLRITIPENNKKLLTVIEKWGFEKTGNIARYIGDDIYIYENIFNLRVHIK